MFQIFVFVVPVNTLGSQNDGAGSLWNLLVHIKKKKRLENKTLNSVNLTFFKRPPIFKFHRHYNEYNRPAITIHTV